MADDRSLVGRSRGADECDRVVDDVLAALDEATSPVAAAMVAARYEPRVKAFYEKLVAKGKKPIQARVAVMRKLLHSIHGMFHSDTIFDGTKFFVQRPCL